MRPTLEDRFWRGVNRNGPTMPGMDTPCWIWTRSRTRGYGRIDAHRKSTGAHRVAWELAYGSPPPADLDVLHRCDNPACVRVEGHLFLGTAKDNIRDMLLKRRNNPATGARNGAYTHPESVPRGDRHGSRTHPEAQVRGEMVEGAKLTPKLVAEIRASVCGGESHRSVGRRFGVSHTNVGMIARGEIWRHVAQHQHARDGE